jgi:hypothetical protein
MEEQPPRFHLWGDLFPDMHGEVGGWLDPFSRQALALTNKAHWARFGKKSSWFHQGFNIAWHAHPQHMQPLWTAMLKRQRMGDNTPFCDEAGDWFEGLGRRGDTDLFMAYVDAAVVINAEMWDALRRDLCAAVHRSNELALVLRAREKYAGFREWSALHGVISVRFALPNIDLLLNIRVEIFGELRVEFLNQLMGTCQRLRQGRALLHLVEHIPEFGAHVKDHYNSDALGSYVSYDFDDILRLLQYWKDIRGIYTFVPAEHMWEHRRIKAALLHAGIPKKPDVYRRLRPLLMEFFPELVHYADFAFIDETDQ